MTTNALFVLLLALVFARYGSISTAIQVLQGQALTVDKVTKSFGVVAPGEQADVSFLLTNHNRVPVRIVGSRTVCDCIARDDRPFVLEPGESRPYDITIDLPSHPQLVHRSLTLYTNIPGQTEVDLSIIGEVAESSNTTGGSHHTDG